MAMCPMCGADVAESACSCPACGADLIPQESTVQPKKGGRKRSGGSKGGALIGILLAVAAFAAAISVGVYALIPVFNPTVAVSRAFAKTGKSMSKVIKQSSELKNAVNNLSAVSENSKISLEFNVDTAEYDAQLQLDFNGSAKKMAGSVSFDGSGTDAELNFYADTKVIQLEIPTFSNDVYGLSTDKLQKLTKSAIVTELLSTVANVELPSDIFEAVSSKTVGFGEKWEAFLKTARTTKGNKANGLQQYNLSWRARDLAELVSDGAVTDLLGERFASLVDFIDTGCVIYVNNSGYIQKVEIVIGDDLYIIEFSAGNQPFSEVEIINDTTGKTVFTGGLKCTKNEFSFVLEPKSGDPIVDIQWKSSNGKYTFYAFGIAFEGRLTSTTKTTELTIAREDGTEIALTISRLTAAPQKIAKQYTDLLDMRLSDVARLTTQIVAHSDTAQETLSALYGYVVQLLN